MKNIKTLIAASTLALAGAANAIPQSVSSGYNHSMFLDAYGNVYIAGDCNIGTKCGPISSTNEPTREFLSATYAEFQNAKYVFAGADVSAIIDKNGDLYYSGAWMYSTGNTMPWTKIAAPGKVVDAAWTAWKKLYFLVETGSYTVNGNTYPESTLYSFNVKTGELVKESEKTDFVSVSANYVAGALDKYGNLYTWGSTDSKLYGDGSSTVRTSVPTEPSITDIKFRKVTFGRYHAIGITPEGVPYTWGSSHGGGPVSATPVRIPGLDVVKDGVANYNNGQFIDSEGKLVLSGSHNLRTYMGQAMRSIPGTSLTVPYEDTTYTKPYMPRAVLFGVQDTSFFYDEFGLRGYSANQYGELAVNSETPEFHVISRTAPFVGTPPMISETDLMVAEASGRSVSDVLKGNASYNNGKGGNYAKTGHEDNGMGQGRYNERRASGKAFAARNDGRGFKRSN